MEIPINSNALTIIKGYERYGLPRETKIDTTKKNKRYRKNHEGVKACIKLTARKKARERERGDAQHAAVQHFCLSMSLHSKGW